MDSVGQEFEQSIVGMARLLPDVSGRTEKSQRLSVDSWGLGDPRVFTHMSGIQPRKTQRLGLLTRASVSGLSIWFGLPHPSIPALE